jgi:hypothetical protein
MAEDHSGPFLGEDKPKEACGVFGIYAPGQDVARITYYGLYALQHRGQESAGIAVSDGGRITCHKGMGLVSEVFTEDTLEKLKGKMALGHVLYTTVKDGIAENIEPQNFYYQQGMIAIGHNGNLTNSAALRREMERAGAVFQSTSDSELIVSLIVRAGANDWGRRWVTIQLLGKSQISDYKNVDFSNMGGEIAILSYGKTDVEWPLVKDAELYRKYLQLDADWSDGFISQGELSESKADNKRIDGIWDMSNIPSEKDQVDPHRVSWSLLAALDKVLGDPVVHGDSGLESKGRGRKPNPDKHFKELSPELNWQTFTLYHYETWTEEEKIGDEVRKKTYKNEYKKNIRLLTSAKCYDADYHYSWDENVVEQKTANGSKKTITPKLNNVTRSGPYYGKLKAILQDAGLNSDMDLELVLRFAENIDPMFQIDHMLFGTPVEINLDTEGGLDFSGSKFPVNPCSGRVTSSFGTRKHPITGVVKMHTGIDIGAPHGSPVVAVKDGYIVYRGDMGAYGNAILIEHGDCRTLYAHLSRFNVKSGDKVHAGQRIGEVGTTGMSTGPHLHFEVRTGKDRTEYLDPAKYLRF